MAKINKTLKQWGGGGGVFLNMHLNGFSLTQTVNKTFKSYLIKEHNYPDPSYRSETGIVLSELFIYVCFKQMLILTLLTSFYSTLHK